MGITPEQYHEMLARTEGNRIRNGIEMPSSPAQDEIEEIHKPIVQWCESFVPYVPYIYSRPDKRTHNKKGVCDLVVFFKGTAILIEAKTKFGKLTTEQLAFALACERQGFIVHVIRSIDEFWKIVDKIKANERDPSYAK